MKLIIVGSGRNVWDDLEKLWPVDCDVMAVNDSIMHYPENLRYAYSNDFEMLPKWVEARRPTFKQKDTNLEMHCCFPCKGAKVHEVGIHANSGLCAAVVSLELGYNEIILCGIPQDNEGHYFDAPWERTNYENSVGRRFSPDHIRYWSNPMFKNKVFSMSGRTREALGAPRGY